MPGRFMGEFAAASRHSKDALRRDDLVVSPSRHLDRIVVEKKDRHDFEMKPQRDRQAVMAIHHKKRVSMNGDRHSPRASAPDFSFQLSYVFIIDFFGWGQFSWIDEAISKHSRSH
jgi:hypothetical protein